MKSINQNYIIYGIKCVNCIEKISTLLESKLFATEIVINENKQLKFNTKIKTELNDLNQLLATIGDYYVSESIAVLSTVDIEKKLVASYKPIYLIFSYLIIVNGLIAYKTLNLNFLMSNFMASFFLVFSFFKMVDLSGFAAEYSKYDLIAKKFYYYGYFYPLMELIFGFAYLIIPLNLYLNIIVLIIMLISTLGVLKAKLTQQKFNCACVGTFLKVPLGNIALIENILMIVMSTFILFKIV